MNPYCYPTHHGHRARGVGNTLLPSGFFWTDDFQFGFSQEIEGKNVSTRVLYLDTKRFQDKAYFEGSEVPRGTELWQKNTLAYCM